MLRRLGLMSLIALSLGLAVGSFSGLGHFPSPIHVGILGGDYWTDDLVNCLNEMPNIEAQRFDDCSMETLNSFQVIIIYGNPYCWAADNLNQFVRNGGGLIATPWVMNNMGELDSLPISPRTIETDHGSSLNIDVHTPDDALIQGVLFQDGDSVGHEIWSEITLRSGAISSVDWKDAPHSVSRYEYGQGRSVYLNFHYITSDCDRAISYQWGRDLIYNAIEWVANQLSLDETLNVIDLPLSLSDYEGYTWDIQGNGTVADGTNDAFDGGLILTIEGEQFPNFSSAVSLSDGREIIIGPANLADLEIVRHIYIPGDDAFARYTEVLMNFSDSPVTITLEIRSDLGSDDSTQIIQTSDWNRQWEQTDLWIITDDDEDGGGDPAVAHVLTTHPTGVALSGDVLIFTYTVTVPAYGEVRLEHFVVQGWSNYQTIERADILSHVLISDIVSPPMWPEAERQDPSSADFRTAFEDSLGTSFAVFADLPRLGLHDPDSFDSHEEYESFHKWLRDEGHGFVNAVLFENATMVLDEAIDRGCLREEEALELELDIISWDDQALCVWDILADRIRVESEMLEYTEELLFSMIEFLSLAGIEDSILEHQSWETELLIMEDFISYWENSGRDVEELWGLAELVEEIRGGDFVGLVDEMESSPPSDLGQPPYSESPDPTRSITVVKPNGVQRWQEKSTQGITWKSQNAGSRVKIEFSTDGGSSWKSIHSSTNNDGFYHWVVPNTPATQCLVRIISLDYPAVLDTSDRTFTIFSPQREIEELARMVGNTVAGISVTAGVYKFLKKLADSPAFQKQVMSIPEYWIAFKGEFKSAFEAIVKAIRDKNPTQPQLRQGILNAFRVLKGNLQKLGGFAGFGAASAATLKSAGAAAARWVACSSLTVVAYGVAIAGTAIVSYAVTSYAIKNIEAAPGVSVEKAIERYWGPRIWKLGNKFGIW